MKAALFHNPGDISYTTVADPRIELATEIILKVTSTAIWFGLAHPDHLKMQTIKYAIWFAVKKSYEPYSRLCPTTSKTKNQSGQNLISQIAKKF